MNSRFATFVLALFFVLGCASKPLIEQFKFGMTKEQVSKILYEPMVPRGITFNKFEQMVEVYQYEEYKPEGNTSKATADTLHGKPSSFYLFFYKDQLIQWGEADDWREVAKLLYDTRFW